MAGAALALWLALWLVGATIGPNVYRTVDTAARVAIVADATGGTYVNFEGDRESREQHAYGENCDRLVELKNEYDPTNLFRMNQNVEPTA